VRPKSSVCTNPDSNYNSSTCSGSGLFTCLEKTVCTHQNTTFNSSMCSSALFDTWNLGKIKFQWHFVHGATCFCTLLSDLMEACRLLSNFFLAQMQMGTLLIFFFNLETAMKIGSPPLNVWFNNRAVIRNWFINNSLAGWTFSLNY